LTLANDDPVELTMNPFLILMYSSIGVSAALLMTVNIKYLKQKALQRQQVKDQVPISISSEKFWTNFCA
jgi:hypothetical protein